MQYKPELEPGEAGNEVQKNLELAQQLLHGERFVTLNIKVMRETAEEIEHLLTEYGWSESEGLVVLLRTGMAFLNSDHALTVLTDVGGIRAKELRRLLVRMIDLESKYAALKAYTFTLMQERDQAELRKNDSNLLHVPIDNAKDQARE